MKRVANDMMQTNTQLEWTKTKQGVKVEPIVQYKNSHKEIYQKTV